jgi:hypothetical protein
LRIKTRVSVSGPSIPTKIAKKFADPKALSNSGSSARLIDASVENSKGKFLLVHPTLQIWQKPFESLLVADQVVVDKVDMAAIAPPSVAEITHIVLACDESGAKGYTNQDEDFPGKTEVFAGIFAPNEYLLKVKPEFDSVAKEIRRRGRKTACHGFVTGTATGIAIRNVCFNKKIWIAVLLGGNSQRRISSLLPTASRYSGWLPKMSASPGLPLGIRR